MKTLISIKRVSVMVILGMLTVSVSFADTGANQAQEDDSVRCQIGINADDCDENSDLHPNWRAYVQRAIYVINHTSCAASVEPVGRLLSAANVKRQLVGRIHNAMSNGSCQAVGHYLRQRLAANSIPQG